MCKLLLTLAFLMVSSPINLIVNADYHEIIRDSLKYSMNRTSSFYLNEDILNGNKTYYDLIMANQPDTRVKRSVNKYYKSKHNRNRFSNLNRIGTCRKFDFNVNFMDLGWEKWILFPKMFNAHFCGGSCSLPLTLRQKSLSLSSGPISSEKFKKIATSSEIKSIQVTNHAQIMSILEYKHPEIMNAQIAKCVSTKLKPLTVIFLDEYGQLKTKQYEDMIVEECGCR